MNKLVKQFEIEIIKNDLIIQAVIPSNHIYKITQSQSKKVFDHVLPQTSSSTSDRASSDQNSLEEIKSILESRLNDFARNHKLTTKKSVS